MVRTISKQEFVPTLLYDLVRAVCLRRQLAAFPSREDLDAYEYQVAWLQVVVLRTGESVECVLVALLCASEGRPRGLHQRCELLYELITGASTVFSWSIFGRQILQREGHRWSRDH